MANNNDGKMAGNKGEWSELYAFLRLLSQGRVYAANEKVEKIDNVYYPILKIIREEQKFFISSSNFFSVQSSSFFSII